jgi:predicted SAM-dependent methyltransferase
MKKWFHSVIVDDYREGFAAFVKQRRAAEARRVLCETNLRKVGALLSSGKPVKIEFGAGEPRGLEGWTYVDKVYTCDLVMDLTEPLSFPDGSVDEIYSSHLLEHFSYRELIFFIGECHRVLKPGGYFGAAVPDAGLFLKGYGEERSDIDVLCQHRPALRGRLGIDVINYIAYMDGLHKYMFDKENILAVLQGAGFSRCGLRDYDECLDLPERKDISIYAYANK